MLPREQGHLAQGPVKQPVELLTAWLKTAMQVAPLQLKLVAEDA